MKSIVNNTKAAKHDEYPRLVTYPGSPNEVVMLLSDDGDGVCISGQRRGCYYPGRKGYSAWRTDNAIPFDGSITLEND